MSFNNSFTAVTGATYTAAQYNTHVRDNFSAVWVYTTAGDIAYATGATTLTRLAIGANGAILKSTGSAPAWVAAGAAGSLFYNNGASTPAWLAIGANGTILKSTGIAPSWVAAGAAGSLFYNNGASTPAWLTVGNSGYMLGSNGSAPVWSAFYRYMTFLLNTDIALNTGDDAVRFRIPAALGGWDIATVAASRKSGTGILTLQIRNVSAAVDVLSTKLTVDSGETDSSTAATPVVINAANDDVQTGEQFAIDVDVAGTNTLYAFVEIGFLKP